MSDEDKYRDGPDLDELLNDLLKNDPDRNKLFKSMAIKVGIISALVIVGLGIQAILVQKVVEHTMILPVTHKAYESGFEIDKLISMSGREKDTGWGVVTKIDYIYGEYQGVFSQSGYRGTSFTDCYVTKFNYQKDSNRIVYDLIENVTKHATRTDIENCIMSMVSSVDGVVASIIAEKDKVKKIDNSWK